jgi:tRNA dimethylallyltransferase
MGPTASGKTQLAIDLVQQFPFEIISVDSAMVYRGMDIGTAKPTPDILKIAPHRLIDIRDPSEPYSVAQFQRDVVREIDDVIANNKIPLLVGGTMLYFSALQKGLSELPSANPSVRAKLTLEAEQFGWPALHERLQQVDPAAGKRIHPHDSQRIQRALEVYDLTGKSITAWQQEDLPTLANYQICNLVVSLDRVILHERIAKRFTQMLAEGFLEEVKSLVARGDLNLEMPSMRSVGYRQVWEYLLGNYAYDEMCEKSIIATRQLAKRQLTWLRHWSLPVTWFDSLAEDLFAQVTQVLEPLISQNQP